MRTIWKEMFGNYFGIDNLYLGCGADRCESTRTQKWTNLDMNAAAHPDIVHNLNTLPLPFASNSFNLVFSCHCFEHLDKLPFISLVADIHRILRPGGYLIAVTPYGSSDVALGMVQHKQAFFEVTWTNLNSRAYEDPHTFGYLDTEELPFKPWDVIAINLIADEAFRDDPELLWKARHLRNVIYDIHAVLQVVK
jgi:SAM-dependent methyltransferase